MSALCDAPAGPGQGVGPVTAAERGAAPGAGAAPRFDLATLMGKSRRENFTVASRLLAPADREHLLAIYGYARFVDDIGDLAPGDRSAQLDWVEAELDRALDGRSTHPVFLRLGRTAAAVHLDREPFADLLAANRQDQVVHRYATYEQLAAYCELSANPVGRLVLAVFGHADERAVACSDSICTGLQLVEHWQDVAEDRAAGRVYLPAEDLERFGVDESELGAFPGPPSPAFRRLMAHEVHRARRLLDAGMPLVGMLSGAGRVAVAGFVAGGRAQLAAIERASYDVLSGPVKASKLGVAAETARVLGLLRPLSQRRR